MKNTLLFTLLALLGMSQAVAQEYEYVPFVREGVKWVYVINNTNIVYPTYPDCPEGIYFQTLELKGDMVINGKTYKAMHKYSGTAIDTENDTVPIFLREEGKIVYGIIPDGRRYEECPIGGPRFDGSEYNGEEFVLYDFNDQDAFWKGKLDLYSEIVPDLYQNISSDTIQLGNHLAKRYINSWLCGDFHYIEGIGVDELDSGYTLGYFMGCPPGYPYFYLSHVVENGQIIYHGLRYGTSLTVGIDEVVADQSRRPLDENYYDLTGRAVGKDVPTVPGIYIHQGKKIVVR